MRDKNPSLLLKTLFLCIFSIFFKLCTIEHDAGSYRKRGRVYAKMEREREREKEKKERERNVSLSPSPTPTAVPREACQCLYCYLICKNGKIVLASVGATKEEKRLINTGEKKIEERNLF